MSFEPLSIDNLVLKDPAFIPKLCNVSEMSLSVLTHNAHKGAPL